MGRVRGGEEGTHTHTHTHTGRHTHTDTQTHTEERTVVSKFITDRHFCWGKFISNYRYRIVLPEELISITETDLWKSPQKVSHYRYRFSIDF